MISDPLQGVRSALFLPASNPRAIAKARSLAADLVILDLEDAVAEEAKAAAREAAVAAAREGGWPGLLAVRINAIDSPHHGLDRAALAGASGIDLFVLPKAEAAEDAQATARALGRPLLAMIETPVGLYVAREIAAAPQVAGLIAGTNDLAMTLRLPAAADRAALALALQMIVLAARAGDKIALDGVFNRLDDAEGFAAECAEGRLLGFDGKSLIHPSQVDPCNVAYAPSPAELEDARTLVAAAGDGAERFRGRMVEALHVAQARRLLARAGQ